MPKVINLDSRLQPAANCGFRDNRNVGEVVVFEKRRAVRFRVPEKTVVALQGDDGEVHGRLVDLSSGGALVAVPPEDGSRFRPGLEIAGTLRREAEVSRWRGHVVHCSPGQNGIGIGLVFDRRGSADKEARQAIDAILDHPEVGGFKLRRSSQGVVLEVVGRLSFGTSRDCLGLIQREAICRIDLTQCRSLDSTGLGTLCRASQKGIALVGARGQVRDMLAIARITPA